MPKFREITGQFVGYVPDGPDTNIVPDRAPMDGRVVFTPVFTGGVVAFPELVPPEFAHPEPIRAKIIDGFVRVEVAVGDDPLVQPLSLMVTVDDEASQVWSWRAEFTNMRIGNGEVEVQIPSWSFRVPDGTGPVDLTELVPLKTSGSVDVTKGPRGAGLENITAIDGQLVFAYSDGQETTVPVPEAVQGPQGEPGPAGADGEQGPEGPQGPAGEIPDLLVGNITDATPTGKNLMLAATEGAARDALGLQTGATSIAGAYSELKPGSTQTNSRVWSPKNISDYVEEQVDAAKVFVNVKDHGAVGDGVADDVQPFRDAIAAVEAAGGGTVALESGKTYWIPDSIQTCENLTIEGNKATIVKIKKPGHVRYAVFQSKKGQGTGYGAGQNRNLTIRNVTFKGNLSTDADQQMDLCAFAGHHHDNVLIDNCTFLEVVNAGHALDLAGCSNVRVTNCQFIGYNSTQNNPRAECIQIDRSVLGALSMIEDVGNYDGLQTKNVTVTGCSFLPLEKDGVKWPCPNPIGSHAIAENTYPTNINFIGNFVEDPAENTLNYKKGIIRFIGAKSINISNNVFKTKEARPNRVIVFEGVTRGAAASWDPNLSYSEPEDLTNHVVCRDVIISGNVFEGFSGRNTASTDGIIGAVNPSTTTKHANFRIENNTFKGTVTTTGANNDAPGTISVERVDNVIVANNTCEMVGNLAYFYQSSNISVTSNTVKDSTTFGVTGSSCVNMSVSDLLFVGGYAVAVYFAGTGQNVSARGLRVNDFKGSTSSACGVVVAGAHEGVLVSDVSSDSTRPAVNISASSVSGGLVTNVLALSASTAVTNSGANITVSNVKSA